MYIWGLVSTSHNQRLRWVLIPPHCITGGHLLQSEVASTRESSGDKSPEQQSLGGQHHRQGALQRAEAAVDSTYQLAAQYIALAQALQPGKEVYRTSLQASVPHPLLSLTTHESAALAGSVTHAAHCQVKRLLPFAFAHDGYASHPGPCLQFPMRMARRCNRCCSVDVSLNEHAESLQTRSEERLTAITEAAVEGRVQGAVEVFSKDRQLVVQAIENDVHMRDLEERHLQPSISILPSTSARKAFHVLI